jgi:hypothetical protein
METREYMKPVVREGIPHVQFSAGRKFLLDSRGAVCAGAENNATLWGASILM